MGKHRPKVDIDLLKIINRGVENIKPYVPGKSIQEVVRERGIKRVIKMASNENPLGLSPAAYRAIKRSLKNSHQYPEVSARKLREALSRKNIVPPEYIMVGNGADEIIYTLAMTFLNDSDEVIIPEITFSMYEIVSLAMRARVIKSKMENLRIDLEDILGKTTSKTKMIFLCNPNNPTGDILRKDELINFIHEIPDNIIIVHDECYSEFANSKHFPNLIPLIYPPHSWENSKNGTHPQDPQYSNEEFNDHSGYKNNIILLRTFSKIYGLAGVRLGYGIAHPSMFELMYRIRPPFGVSVPAQEAGIAALGDERFLRKTLKITNEGKEYIYKELEKMGLPYVKSHTNFVLIDTQRDSKEVSNRMISRGIIVRPMTSYGLPTHIRVTIGLKKHNERFINSLKQVIDEIKEQG